MPEFSIRRENYEKRGRSLIFLRQNDLKTIRLFETRIAWCFGAGNRTWTCMNLHSYGPEPYASANSAIPAYFVYQTPSAWRLAYYSTVWHVCQSIFEDFFKKIIFRIKCNNQSKYIDQHTRMDVSISAQICGQRDGRSPARYALGYAEALHRHTVQ